MSQPLRVPPKLDPKYERIAEAALESFLPNGWDKRHVFRFVAAMLQNQATLERNEERARIMAEIDRRCAAITAAGGDELVLDGDPSLVTLNALACWLDARRVLARRYEGQESLP